MGVAKPEPYIDSLFLEEAFLIGYEYGQTVHGWRSAYLECQRVETAQLSTLLACSHLLLVIGIVAGCKHACKGK